MHSGAMTARSGVPVRCLARADGKRKMSVAVNVMRWNKLDFSSKAQHHPMDDALPAFYQFAMRGPVQASALASARSPNRWL